LGEGLLPCLFPHPAIVHMVTTGLFGFAALDLLLVAASIAACIAGLRHGWSGLNDPDAGKRTEALLGTLLSLGGPAIYVGLFLYALSQFELPS
jgi:hypothetical protein